MWPWFLRKAFWIVVQEVQTRTVSSQRSSHKQVARRVNWNASISPAYFTDWYDWESRITPLTQTLAVESIFTNTTSIARHVKAAVCKDMLNQLRNALEPPRDTVQRSLYLVCCCRRDRSPSYSDASSRQPVQLARARVARYPNVSSILSSKRNILRVNVLFPNTQVAPSPSIWIETL